MKLFIYYSLTGNGELVSEKFSEKGYEIRRIYEKKKMPKSFFFMILSGGFRASVNAKAKLLNYDADVSKYEEIVIGSPVWNGRFPPAINAVLKQTDFSNKKLSFVIYSGSGEGKKAEEKVKKLYPDSKILFLQEPKKYPEQLKKVENFF